MKKGATQGTQSLRTTILVCMLVVCFETYHGDHTAALSQIQVCLALKERRLGSTPSQSRATYFGEIEYLKEEICVALDRLDMQVMSFPDLRSRAVHQAMMNCHADAMDAVPRTFTTIRAARFYADSIMCRLMHFRVFYAEYHRDTMSGVVKIGPPSCLGVEREIDIGLAKLIGYLECWQNAFAPLMNQLQEKNNLEDYFCGIALQ
jgi:hypothetical protein